MKFQTTILSILLSTFFILWPDYQWALAQEKSYLLADYDDSYDPFSDFSEYEQQSEEEEDINFFRNGRFLTVGLVGGYRGFTDQLQKVYSSAPLYGIFFDYFFDLHFALEANYLIGDHHWSFAAGNEFRLGTAQYTDFGINLKYYFNTDNVTKGLADLSPYVVVGFSQIYRRLVIYSESNIGGVDATQGLNLGTGIEIPMMKNKMFFGFQLMYQYVSFPDEQEELIINNTGSGIRPSGDSYTIFGLMGINF